MILGHGIDVVEIPRLARMLQRHGRRFVERVFTPAERDYCRGKKRELEHLAGRFAAKEAVMKVLGTGWAGRITWQDIEVTNAPGGQPRVALSGESARVAEQLGIRRVLISISHTGDWAAASAIGVGDGSG
jgi:holo-[acyl-carrier protein] synthase